MFEFLRRKKMFSHEVIKSLTETEKIIQEYILQNKNMVSYMRIRDISAETHVSPASIVRFVKKVGYDSFAELKIAIRQSTKAENVRHLFSTHEIVDEFFNRTLTSNYNRKLEKAVNLISESKLIYLFGIGSSGIMAEYGARQFLNFGKRAFYIKDPFYPIGSSKEDFSDAVVIVLSVSGETDQVLNRVNALRGLGSKIISITNTSNNSLNGYSDVNLAYHLTSELTEDLVNITSQVPVLFLLETLARKTYINQNSFSET